MQTGIGLTADTRRHVHRDADGEPRGLGGAGCCSSEAAEEAETGDPVSP